MTLPEPTATEPPSLEPSRGPLTEEGGVYIEPFVCQGAVAFCALAGVAYWATGGPNFVFVCAAACLGLAAIGGAAHVLIAGATGWAKHGARWTRREPDRPLDG